MAFQLNRRLTLFRVTSVAFAGLLLITPQAQAQVAENPAAEAPAEAETAADPFAVPEGATAEELMAFITSVKQQRGRTMESVVKAASAAVARETGEAAVLVDNSDTFKSIQSGTTKTHNQRQTNRKVEEAVAAHDAVVGGKGACTFGKVPSLRTQVVGVPESTIFGCS